MIPDFKTYIGESIWSDMQDRGNGDAFKKEDGVNLMNKDQFFEYLKKHYVYTGPNPEKYSIKKDCRYDYNRVIFIPIYQFEERDEPYYLRIDYNIKKKTISKDSTDKIDTENSIMIQCESWMTPDSGFFERLDNNERFGVEEIREYDDYGDYVLRYLNIYPYDYYEKIDNQYFIDVIDYLIGDMDKDIVPVIKKNNEIKESIWSDMQDRGNGDIIKAEDDINNMDYESLYEYVKENYEIDVDQMGWAEDTNNPDNTYFYTYVPILSTKERNDAVYYLCRDFSMPCTVSINSEITHDYDSKIYKTLKDNYIVKPIDSDFLSISPKNGGKVDNEFFLEVLNFIIDNTDETYLNVRHKSVNESVWSDMQDRGSGDLIKKEDDLDVDLMDHNEFCDYLNDHYKARLGKIEYSSSLNELEVPILTQGTGWHALLTMEYGRVKRICFGKDLPNDFPEVFMQINKKFILRREKHKRWISFYFYQAKNVGEATNSFFLTVLDFIISTGDKSLIVSKK